jgi:asparagine synthase (glutamine-hydrolysing)
MCGIAVITSESGRPLREEIVDMVEMLSHRGPDDSGVEVIPADGVALGMRRLSIIDVATGRQPLWNEDRTVCVVFNGEIYNFRELRVELAAQGHAFATHHSDSEVLVHGYEEWGVELFPRLNGMFACAIWDRCKSRLVLGRDRIGEKPLYIARLSDGYAIASELKALLRNPRVPREIDSAGLDQYLSFDYTLAPRTVLRDVIKLPAAHFALIESGSLTWEPYWIPDLECRAVSHREALERLDALLQASVRARMVADVPVGLFLSGGVDSSTIGYYMSQHCVGVQSFSIGFEEPSYDESAYARTVAAHLGLDHHTEVLSAVKAHDLLLRVPEILDEPMADSSILPTYLLSQFTRRSVKVALGGDGSDELLMGYRAYQPLKVAWELDRLPKMVRRSLAKTAERVPDAIGQRSLRGVQFLRRLDETPTERFLNHLGSYKGDARWLLTAELRSELPANVASEPQMRILNGVASGKLSGANETVLGYLRSYLQEDILVKVDRASMATSLEVRSPFLEPELVNFALSLPSNLKMKGLTRKYLLRKLMRGRLPPEILNRPKKGFGVPLDAWLRGPLAPVVRDYLHPRRIADAGLFDPEAVSRISNEHLSGQRNRGNELWLLLHFELWRERWLCSRSAPERRELVKVA